MVPPVMSILLDNLPTWISTNIRSKTSWKLIARCWLASWVAFVLLLPHKSLNAMGNAAFFCCIVSFIVPPFLPVQMFFFAMAIMVLGCLLGWAWGAAAMGAALAARDQVLLQSAILKAQQSAAGRANPDALFMLQVFQGAFLDTRSSVIFGVFFGVGAFVFALVRAYNPKLALFSVFGTIFLDVICSYGPLFPSSSYFILNSFFISTTSYVAIGCVVILLVFPETLNHQYLNSISSMLAIVRQLVEAQDKVLSIPDIADIQPKSSLATEIREKTGLMIGDMQKMNEKSKMLHLEFTFGRFNGSDAKSVAEPLKRLVARIAGLQAFSRFLGGGLASEPDVSHTPQSELHSSHKGDTYLLHHLRASHHNEELERSLRPQDVLPILRSATADLRTACVKSLFVAEELVARVNRRRWQRTPLNPEPNVDDHLAELRRAREDFQQRRRLEVVEPFSGARPYRALFVAFVFQANLLWCADATIDLLEVLADLSVKRRKKRLWAPTGLRMLWKVVRSNEESDRRALGEDERPTDMKLPNGDKRSYRRDPDSSPPTYAFQYVGDFFYRVYKWCKTPEAIYAFKYLVVSVALWLPSVFPRSAYFVYVNKALWALIMAQTTLEPYIADQIYSYVARLTATTTGILIGLVAWYIGAARGNGNPFGIAAVMAVLLLPLIFWRLFTPSPLPAIMCSVTTILVVGYSWLDAHLQIVGSPGVGWPVAWRRWLLVMIGAGASFLLMLVPPKSGRRAVRLGHATLVSEISHLYAQLISRWITADEVSSPSRQVSSTVAQRNQKGQDALEKEEEHEQIPARQDLPAWASAFRSDIGSVWIKAQRLRVQTETARWEGNIRGAWPGDTYVELLNVETEILANLAQLAGALLHLNPDWRMRLLHRTKVLNPHFISDVITVFSLISQSLRTGEPLHEVLPQNLVDRVFYHHTLLPSDDPNETDTKRQGEPVEDTLEQLRSQEYMSYATGVSAVFQILTLLDHMHQITKTLCGEVPLKGFQEWRELFEHNRIDGSRTT